MRLWLLQFHESLLFTYIAARSSLTGALRFISFPSSVLFFCIFIFIFFLMNSQFNNVVRFFQRSLKFNRVAIRQSTFVLLFFQFSFLCTTCSLCTTCICKIFPTSSSFFFQIHGEYWSDWFSSQRSFTRLWGRSSNFNLSSLEYLVHVWWIRAFDRIPLHFFCVSESIFIFLYALKFIEFELAKISDIHRRMETKLCVKNHAGDEFFRWRRDIIKIIEILLHEMRKYQRNKNENSKLTLNYIIQMKIDFENPTRNRRNYRRKTVAAITLRNM